MSTASAPQDNNLKGIFYAFLTAIVGTGIAISSKVISSTVSVPQILLVQYSICMLVITPWLFKQRLVQLQSTRWPLHLLRGCAGWASFYCFYLSVDHIPLVDASLLRHTAPLIVPLIAWFALRVAIPRARWIPLTIGFIGIVLILRPGSQQAGIWHLVGLLSGAGLALSMITTRMLSATESSHLIVFYYFSISLLASLPQALLQWQPMPLWTWPYLGFMGISTYLAMHLYTSAYSYAKPSIIAPISYFSVVLAGLVGWLVWDHIPDNIALTGIAIVVAAGSITLFLANRGEGAPLKQTS